MNKSVKRILWCAACATLGFIIFVVYQLATTSPAQVAANRQAAQQLKASQDQAEAFAILDGIKYVQDSRTDPPTCFAYRVHHQGSETESLAIATVPCKSVPEDLLIIGKGDWKD